MTTDKKKQECLNCKIPREYYDLKIEPGLGNPDFNMGSCSHGHYWTERINYDRQEDTTRENNKH